MRFRLLFTTIYKQAVWGEPPHVLPWSDRTSLRSAARLGLKKRMFVTAVTALHMHLQ